MLMLLTGCAGGNGELDRALAFRDKLLNSSGCSFDAVITADYGDKVYTFSLNCKTDASGDLSFSVTDPESIADITGIVNGEEGKLTFDDKALAFEVLADGYITPVSAPWHLIHTLQSGYISSCGKDGDYLRLAVDDSYEEDALHMDIWLDEDDMPIRGEILWQGKRVLSLDVRNFAFV